MNAEITLFMEKIDFCSRLRLSVQGTGKDVTKMYGTGTVCICGSVNSKEKDSRTKARREKVDRTKMYIRHRKKRTIDQR